MDIESYFDDFEDRDWQRGAEGTLRLAMVGLGWWTTDRAMPAVAETEHCETTVVVSGTKEKAEGVAEEEELAAGITYEEFQNGEASDAYDAVYICTPNATHLENALAAAEMGKDVLCEKPMEGDVERAEEMVEAFEGVDVQLMVAYRMHTEPSVRRMKELVEEGFIGEPLAVHGHMSQSLLEMIPNPDQWRLNPELAGRGTSVTDLGIYPINTTRFVLDTDPVSVTAQMVSEAEGFEDVPDERATMTIDYDGVTASISASQNMYSTGHLKIIGSEGELTLEPCFGNRTARTLELRRNNIETTTVTPQPNQMLEEFAYFADRVLNDDPVHPDGEHGLHDMRTLEAVYDAAETGERQDI